MSTLDGQPLAKLRGLTTEHVPFQRVEFADGSALEGDALLQGLLSSRDTGVSLGGEGDDLLAGGDERDLMLGRAGHDRLEGGAGNDELQGGEGNDLLSGSGGNHLLIGGAGDNRLSGGAGVDQVVGGSGLDTFVLDTSGGSSSIRDDATRPTGSSSHRAWRSARWHSNSMAIRCRCGHPMARNCGSPTTFRRASLRRLAGRRPARHAGDPGLAGGRHRA